jgi:glycosyltransferase involved in cell wall biosynthesis
MTVQNKIYEGLAMAVPVLTGHAKEISRGLKHGEHVYLCPREDGKALAEGILELHRDPALRRRLAEQGHQIFMDHYSLEQLGKRYLAHLNAALLAKGARR